MLKNTQPLIQIQTSDFQCVFKQTMTQKWTAFLHALQLVTFVELQFAFQMKYKKFLI